MKEQDKYVALCRQIVMDQLNPDKYLVFLFGSRVHGLHRRFADIDIGIQGKEPVPAAIIENMREAIDDSIVPYPVDIVDFYRVSPEFKKVAMQNIEIWNQPENHIPIN
jgi:predicted nucleotidyltransferase